MKKIPGALALVVVFVVCLACGTAPHPSTADGPSQREASRALALAVSDEGEELTVMSEALERFLGAIAGRYGAAAAVSLSAVRTPRELRELLAVTCGTTPYEEALDAFMRWDRESRALRWDKKKLERTETQHFVVLSMPATPGYRDREYIASLLEKQLAAIASIMVPDATMEARFQANLDSLAGRKVEVLLPPSSRAFKGFGDTANTNWGFSLEGGGLAIVASIQLPYYNALSASILAHEETHLLDIFYKLDLSSAPPLPKGSVSTKAFVDALRDWAKALFARIIPNDTGFGEGFAEYVASKLSPAHKVFLGDVDETLALMSHRTPLLDDILVSSPTSKDRRARIVRYTELHSFVSYLIRRSGRQAFMDFYMKVPFSEKEFVRVYGKNFSAMQAEWKAARGF